MSAKNPKDSDPKKGGSAADVENPASPTTKWSSERKQDEGVVRAGLVPDVAHAPQHDDEGGSDMQPNKEMLDANPAASSTGGATEGGAQQEQGSKSLADYAGTAADSFAQAFVDQWASKHNKDTTKGEGDSEGAGVADSSKKEVQQQSKAAVEPSSKQWFVCNHCKNMAFMSQIELKDHEQYCEMNPVGERGGPPGSGGPPVGVGAMGAMPGAVGSMQMGCYSRGGSLGSGHQHQGMMQPGGQPQGMMGRGPQPPPHQPAFVHMNMPHQLPHPGMNPYMQQQLMCGDNSMMMNQMNMYGMQPSLTNVVQACAVSNPPPRRRRTKPKISQEVIEASKGPFCLLPKPIYIALEEDKDWLTPLHCMIRKHCVELFTATEADVNAPTKGKRKGIHAGQIGIRCPFCHEGRANSDVWLEKGSVYYPTSISSIYNATMNLLQRHMGACPKVPPHLVERYHQLKKDDARSGTSKRYWIESAKSLGLVDTIGGIKVSAKAAPPMPMAAIAGQKMMQEEEATTVTKLAQEVRTVTDGSEGKKEESERDGEGGDGKVKTEEDDEDDDGGEEKKDEKKLEEENPIIDVPLVIPTDKKNSTTFSFLLMTQMQPCVFTEADRLGKRKDLPNGFAGIACRHCFGGYGAGRFFPSSIKTLSDTSKTLNVLHNHMSRCRKVPRSVVEDLNKAKESHAEQRAKMKFGSQKAFFSKIWSRLHDNRPDGAVIKAPPPKPRPSSNNDGANMRIRTLQEQIAWNAAAGVPVPMTPVMHVPPRSQHETAGQNREDIDRQHPMMIGYPAGFDPQMAMAAQMAAIMGGGEPPPSPGMRVAAMPPPSPGMAVRGMPHQMGRGDGGDIGPPLHEYRNGDNKRSAELSLSEMDDTKKRMKLCSKGQ